MLLNGVVMTAVLCNDLCTGKQGCRSPRRKSNFSPSGSVARIVSLPYAQIVANKASKHSQAQKLTPMASLVARLTPDQPTGLLLAPWRSEPRGWLLERLRTLGLRLLAGLMRSWECEHSLLWEPLHACLRRTQVLATMVAHSMVNVARIKNMAAARMPLGIWSSNLPRRLR